MSKLSKRFWNSDDFRSSAGDSEKLFGDGSVAVSDESIGERSEPVVFGLQKTDELVQLVRWVLLKESIN